MRIELIRIRLILSFLSMSQMVGFKWVMCDMLDQPNNFSEVNSILKKFELGPGKGYF